MPEPPSGSQFVLQRAGQRAAVTEAGATLRSWRVDERQQLDTFQVHELDDGFRGKVLAPWPNRIRDGRYVFAGTEHRTAVSEPERGSALHGLVLWVNWRPLRRAVDRVALGYVLHPQPGYPFTLRLEVEYRLEPDGLAVTLRATNVGSATAPFGAGFHPYLTVGKGRSTTPCWSCPHGRASRWTTGCCPPAARSTSKAPSTTSVARARSGRSRWTRPSAISSAAPTGSRASGSPPPTAGAR